MKEIVTSQGDGDRITLSDDELRKDIIEGSEDAARKGKIDGLSLAEINHLADIFRQPGKIVSVDPGKEVVVSDDGAGLMASWGRPSAGHAIPISDHQPGYCRFRRRCRFLGLSFRGGGYQGENARYAGGDGHGRRDGHGYAWAADL